MWRLRSLTAETADQRVYYSQGVGTQRGELARGGVTGYGIDDEIIRAYTWSCERDEERSPHRFDVDHLPEPHRTEQAGGEIGCGQAPRRAIAAAIRAWGRTSRICLWSRAISAIRGELDARA